MRLRISFVTLLAKRVTCAQLHYLHKMLNAMLILSQDTHERIARTRSCDKSFSFNFSFSRSLALLSRSLALYHIFLCFALFFSAPLLSLLLSHSLCQTQFVTPFSLLLSFFPSLFFVYLSHFLSFLSHPVTSSLRLISSLSPFVTLCMFPFLFD